jgi:tetratricopeptide (TPR) repeat protein
MTSEPHNSVEVFYSYAHEDEKLRDELKKHLSNLKRQGVITDWYDRDISAGKEWDDEIKQHLESARVFLLLISPDFMDSDYIHDVEVKRAMDKHASGEARVIPVILRPVDWEGAPFSKLEGLPTDVKPVTSWDDRDEAFLDITRGIRKAVQELSGPAASVPTVPDIPRPPKVGFVSRRDKDGHDIVERLREELAPEKNQLVALWGGGGVGKTTLAAEAVRSLAETYGQRIIWSSADSRPNYSFSTLLDDIAEQLGRTDLRPLAVGSKEEALRPLINTKPSLIVLDNVETIRPEEESRCLEFLAKRVHCPALLTTRERIADAYLIPLTAMAPDEAEEFLKRLILQSPDPDIYKVVDVQRILQTAEYNPLIIQWIVGQIDLAQVPNEVLSDLAHGEGDAAHRVFNRSYNLPQLNDGGRAVLLALALFRPSAGRPTLAAVAGMDLRRKRDKDRFKKAQEVLASLWLVNKMNAGLRLGVAGLTRELARSCLGRDPRSTTFKQRFIARFSEYVQKHKNVNPSDLNAVELERENILGAMDLAFADGNWKAAKQIMRFIAFPGMLDLRGYWDHAMSYGEKIVEAAKLDGDEWIATLYQAHIANVLLDRGEYDLARRAYQDALDLSRKREDENNVSRYLNQVANVAVAQEDFEGAERLLNESLQLAKRRDDRNVAAIVLTNLAACAAGQNDLQRAQRVSDEGLELAREFSDPSVIAASLNLAGSIRRRQGNDEEARKFFEESLSIRKKLGDQSGIAITTHQLASLAESEGDKVEAIRLLEIALEIFEKLRSVDANITREDLERVRSRL